MVKCVRQHIRNDRVDPVAYALEQKRRQEAGAGCTSSISVGAYGPISPRWVLTEGNSYNPDLVQGVAVQVDDRGLPFEID
jgi:hypothetical protein